MRARFAEADAWIECNIHGVDATGYGMGKTLSKKISHLAHHIFIARMLLHRARRPLHVHDHQPRPRAPHDFRHRGIAAQTGDIIDNRRASLHRGGGDFGFAGVDRDHAARFHRSHGAYRTYRPYFLRQRANHRQHAAHFLRLADRIRAGAGRFAADVDDLRAFLHHLQAVGDRGIHSRIPAAVGKRIQRHIEHPHDPGARSEVSNSPLAEAQVMQIKYEY